MHYEEEKIDSST